MNAFTWMREIVPYWLLRYSIFFSLCQARNEKKTYSHLHIYLPNVQIMFISRLETCNFSSKVLRNRVYNRRTINTAFMPWLQSFKHLQRMSVSTSNRFTNKIKLHNKKKGWILIENLCLWKNLICLVSK